MHTKGLMGSFGVVLFSEHVESFLLFSEVLLRRNGCFLFQGKMHSLVFAVLLGFARLYLFRVNSQFDPPDREGRQSGYGA